MALLRAIEYPFCDRVVHTNRYQLGASSGTSCSMARSYRQRYLLTWLADFARLQHLCDGVDSRVPSRGPAPRELFGRATTF
jgi:hypothetical protein